MTPDPQTQTGKLYHYLVSGKVYSHSMCFDLGIAGTASPKRLQEAKKILEANELTLEEKWVTTSTGKEYKEYRVVKIIREPVQTNLFQDAA